MDRFYLTIRKATVPPAIAVIMLVLIGAFYPETFGSAAAFAYSVLFLGILPLLAYPLQRFIPRYKDRGREGQRALAMVFSVVGYVAGVVTGLLTGAPTNLILIYLEYLASGILITLFNKGFHLKASGHACGIVGPVAMLAYFKLYLCSAIGCALAALVFVASIKTRRHTLGQLIGGSIIPVAALLLLLLILK